MVDQRAGWDGVVAPRELPVSYSELAEANRTRQAEQDKQSLWSLATDDAWLVNSIGRAVDRSSFDFQDDPTFKVDDHTKDQLSQEFGFNKANEIIKGAKSQGELEARLNWNRTDIARHNTIAQYGWEGTAATLGAALFDPVGWGAAAITAPVYGAARLTQASRLVRGAAYGAMGAAEGAAYGAVMQEGDTTISAHDLYVMAGFGGVLGGTIGLATRTRAATALDRGDDAPAMTISAADTFDREASKAVREAMEYDAYMAARSNDPNPATGIDADMFIQDHISELRRRGNVRVGASEKGKLKNQIRELETRIEGYRASHTAERAELAARTGVVRGAEQLDYQVAKATMARRWEEPIKDAQTRLDELNTRLQSIDDAGVSKAETKRFTSLTREQQMTELGLLETRQVTQNKSAVRDALRALREERRAAEPESPTEIFNRAEAERTGGADAADSIGAQRVAGSQIDDERFILSDRMDDLMDDLHREGYNNPVRALKVLGNASSSFSVLSNSKNMITRGLALRLLENPQGGSATGRTASILTDVNNNLIRTAERNRYNDGFSLFLKEQGMSPLAYLRPEVTRQFDEQIYTAIRTGIPQGTPESIRMAAEGLRDKFAKALELRKASGERGFENVNTDPTYIPDIFHGIRINEATNRIGKQGVIDLLAEGYRTGKFKLGAASAKAVAETQYLRAMDSTLSSRVAFDRVVSQEQQALLIADMQKAGVPDSIIDDFINGVELREMADSVSNRAKTSLGINTQATTGELRVQDLMNTNVTELADNYGKEAAGGAAMARMGFRSKQEVFNVIDAAERAGRNMDGADIKQLRKEADMMRDSVKQIYGNTLDADPNSALVRGTRRLREVTGILRLGQMGFAQLPEFARSSVKLGLGTVLSNVPATRFFRSRAGRRGGVASGELLEPELREVEQLVGYVGEDNWLTGWSTRHDEFGETADNLSKLSRVADNALAMGGRLNVILSGFKAIQGGMEKVVSRSIAQRLKEHALGERTMREADLIEAGFTPDVMQRLKRHMEANPLTENFNGREVRLMNFDLMEPALREEIGTGIARMKGRLIQRNFIGDEGTWMNKWWGKALTQFKAFSIVSLEKQLVHDLRGDKIQAAMILAWSTLLAYGAYSAQMHLQSLGRADSKEFLDEKMGETNLLMGIFNKMPQTASLSLGGDILGTLGLMPDALMQAPGRTGFQNMGFGELVPAAGVVGDAVDLSRALTQYSTGSDDVSTRDLVTKIRRLVPLANTIGIGQVTKAAVDLTED